MTARVTLKLIEGEEVKAELVFDERATCVVGRAADCHLRVPNDPANRKVSRHHCLLDVNPPDARVRDLGSRNGTYVNGEKIGQRERGKTPDEAALAEFPEHDLKHGDEITLSKRSTLAVRLEISLPVDSPQPAPADAQPGQAKTLHLPDLSEDAPPANKSPPSRSEVPNKAHQVCAKCGGDVSGEVGERRQGEYLCRRCRSNPEEIVEFLLYLADQGNPDLVGLRDHRLVEELGRGGMGIVYLIRHRTSGDQCAFKAMLPRVAADRYAKESFLREAENTKALRHTNVVQLREAGCSHGVFFLTLDYCDGGSIDALAKRRGGTLSMAEAVPIVLQVLDGLDYAHRTEVPRVKLAAGHYGRGRGLVHRDLGPQNIFLSGAGRNRVAKVGDYGLSKAFDLAGLSGLTCTGKLAGKPGYMPRQQVINYRNCKPEVDVWAMAASLYDMLTGCVPRDFPKGADPWRVILETRCVPIRRRDRSIPKRLAKVIDEALIDQPAIRFQSAAELKRALQKVL